MEVNVNKTVAQLFSMSTRNHQINLMYNGKPIEQVNLSTYLGITLDTKLSWNAHITLTAEKGHKRTNLLKRLTATKWGATQDVLTTAYKTYVRPVMEYGSEAIAVASKTTLQKLDVVQNNALRTITGGAMSTPILAMNLQTGIEPLENRRDKYSLKFWERAKRVDGSYWNDCKSATQRLKTQISPMTHAESLIKKYNIKMGDPAPLCHFNSVVPFLPLSRLNLFDFSSNKSSACTLELKAHALETIHQLYPEPDWIHIYTDGSYLPETRGAGAGWYCRLFEDSSAVGTDATNYDGEVCAIYEAANKLLDLNETPKKVVFLVDSQAAISAVSNNSPSDCFRTINCRAKLSELINIGWTTALQWIPSHVGIAGNERADILAKHGASSAQPVVPITLQRANNLISNTVNKINTDTSKNLCRGKLWEELASIGPIPKDLERAKSVALFRLKTGHDYLQSHLHRIGLAADDICPLCRTDKMDGSHLKTCTELEHIPDDVIGRYWEARRRMMETSRTGVG